MKFKYSGPIESSKSIVNRALILSATFPNLKISYESKAKDILELKKSLDEFNKSQHTNLNTESLKDSFGPSVFDLGSGGTTFRFFAIYVSKFKGQWVLEISPQLAKRPHDGIVEILSQLGVKSNSYFNKKKPYFIIDSEGWAGHQVDVDFIKSSQFFSGLALAAADSKNDFKINCLNRDQSSGYEAITLKLLKDIGCQVKDQNNVVVIKSTQKLEKPVELNIGADWSSVIYLLSFCFSGSEIEITNLDLNSAEPDRKGLEFLKELGLNFELKQGIHFYNVKTKPSEFKKYLKIMNLKYNPDLFPVMAILLSQIALVHNIEVAIEYPEQLIYKESDRLKHMIIVLGRIGFQIDSDLNTKRLILKIKSSPKCDQLKKDEKFDFDSDSDHRLVMSYELLKSFGYNISYDKPESVKKSFSNFFEIVNG